MKATITRADGTVIKTKGTPEEIAALVGAVVIPIHKPHPIEAWSSGTVVIGSGGVTNLGTSGLGTNGSTTYSHNGVAGFPITNTTHE